MKMHLFLGIITAAFWVFAFKRAYEGRNIRYTCAHSSDRTYAILFTILGALVLIPDRSPFAIVCAILIALSGFFIRTIPSGYDDDYVYVAGRKFPFEAIRDMRLEENTGYVTLHFETGGRYYLIKEKTENRAVLDALLRYYRKGRRS
ncbi:MAG: hypothetical protein IIZ47_01205 [Erysipelotrichaceae bacterium]|nr:hypothetical protein [Erysipelotrichaceae bacterium]